MAVSIFAEHVRQRLAQFDDFSTADSGRLFHGRGCCYPGFEQIALDWFAPVLLLTLFKEADADWEQALIRDLQAQVEAAISAGDIVADAVAAILVQRRYLPQSPTEVVQGALPEKVFARRGDLRFELKLGSNQNTGFFLDMEPGRQWLESLVDGRKLLNLFSYTCAFSVVGQAAGASSVVNVDMSRGALSQGRDNHHLNQLPTDSIRFLGENILKSWSRISKPGPFDVAVIDPPSFQRGSFVAHKDYVKVLRRIPQLMNPGADLLICLNAPELDVEFIRQRMSEGCPECELVGRLEPHVDFPDIDPEQQLKLFHFRYLPKGDNDE